MLGVCMGEEDEDEVLDSDDAIEIVERRVDPRDRFGLATGQGQMSWCSFKDESDEDDIQLQGRGPLSRYVFLWVSIERG